MRVCEGLCVNIWMELGVLERQFVGFVLDLKFGYDEAVRVVCGFIARCLEFWGLDDGIAWQGHRGWHSIVEASGHADLLDY